MNHTAEKPQIDPNSDTNVDLNPGAPKWEQIPTGPVGVVPDNSKFWPVVNAVTFKAKGAGMMAVYQAVAWHVALTDRRICYATVATIGVKAHGMGPSATRSNLRKLEAAGHIVAVSSRVGGRKTIIYRLTVLNRGQRLPLPRPTVTVAEEVSTRRKEDGSELRASAPVCSTVRTDQEDGTQARPWKGAGEPLPEPSPEIQRKARETLAEADQAFELSLVDGTAAELRQSRVEAEAPILKPSDGCPACGHDRMMGGSCEMCGHDIGIGFRMSADWNMGGD